MTLVTAKFVWYFLKAWYLFGTRMYVPIPMMEIDRCMSGMHLLNDIHNGYGHPSMGGQCLCQITITYFYATASRTSVRYLRGMFFQYVLEITHIHIISLIKKIALPMRVHTGYQWYDGIKTHLVTSCLSECVETFPIKVIQSSTIATGMMNIYSSSTHH